MLTSKDFLKRFSPLKTLRIAVFFLRIYAPVSYTHLRNCVLAGDRGLYSQNLSEGIFKISADGGGVRSLCTVLEKPFADIGPVFGSALLRKARFLKAEQLFVLLENYTNGSVIVFKVARIKMCIRDRYYSPRSRMTILMGVPSRPKVERI